MGWLTYEQGTAIFPDGNIVMWPRQSVAAIGTTTTTPRKYYTSWKFSLNFCLYLQNGLESFN